MSSILLSGRRGPKLGVSSSTDEQYFRHGRTRHFSLIGIFSWLENTLRLTNGMIPLVTAAILWMRFSPCELFRNGYDSFIFHVRNVYPNV